MKTITVVAVALLALAGCTPYTYTRYLTNNDASEQQFMQDRYQCYQQTQQPVSVAYLNAYGGAASSQVLPSCSAFQACLAARGYYRSDTQNLADLSAPGSVWVPQSARINCAP
jgi:hypothetical protein